MTLAKKTTLIISVTLLALIVALYAISFVIVGGGFSSLERRETIQNVHRVLEAFWDDVDKLNFTAKDWSNWDDTYQYIEDHNEQYFKSNLNANSLSIIKMNAVLYANAQEKTVFSTGVDLNTVKKIPFPKSFTDQLAERDFLLKHKDIRGSISGILMLPENPMIVASRPILTSKSEGPIRGTLIFGRYYDQSLVNQLAQRTHFKIELRRYDSLNKIQLSEQNPIVIQPINSNQIAGYGLIKDIYGKPALYLKVQIPREIYHQGLESLKYLVSSLLVVGLVFTVLTLFLLMKLVLVRLARLNSTVRKIRTSQDLSIRIPVVGKDELANLAEVINNMLEEIQISESHREKVEIQLRQVQKMDAVGRVAGGIAHDFNNLLTAVIGYCDILLKQFSKNDPAYKNIEEIKKAGEKAAALTHQLLAFSRKQILEPRVLNVNHIVSEMDKMLQRLIHENIELITILENDVWKVKADLAQLEQVIVNLVLNARDAMPKGGKLIIETANVKLDDSYHRQRPEIQPGEYVMLAISDSGIGMSKEVLDHLFEPFFTTKQRGRGTGLGLSTVFGIVKQSEGSIFAYSEPGLGTTIKIYLPRVEGIVKFRPSHEILPASSDIKETVLLVEDEEIVRKFVHEILEKEGYSILEASNGKEALEISGKYEGSIHLLLTDVVMPKMGGKDLAQRFKMSHPEARILYMSGYLDSTVISEDMLKEGAGFIQKPFLPENLKFKLREVLSHPVNPSRLGRQAA